MKFRFLALFALSLAAGIMILAKAYLSAVTSLINRYKVEIKVESYLPLQLSRLDLKYNDYEISGSKLSLRSFFPHLKFQIEELNIIENKKERSSYQTASRKSLKLPIVALLEVSNLKLVAKNHQIQSNKLSFELNDSQIIRFKARTLKFDDFIFDQTISGIWNRKNKSISMTSHLGYHLDFSYLKGFYLKTSTPLSAFSRYVDQLKLTGNLEIETSWETGYPNSAQARLTDLSLMHPILSHKPIEDVEASITVHRIEELWKTKISFYKQGSEDQIEALIGIKLKNKQLILSRLILKDQNCNSLNQLLGNSLFTIIHDEKLTGEMNLDFEFMHDLKNDISDFKLRKIENTCKLDEDTAIFNRYTFRAKNKKIFRKLGSKSAKALASSSFQKNISPYLALLLVSSEDTGFWNHPGWEKKTLEIALKENLKEKKIKLGASTITMQLVKNLYLSPKRSLARKLEEFILASHLESILSKDEILTIYANVIEFAPNIYGVEQASQTLFSRSSLSLSPMQALYLSSILPKPGYYTRLLCYPTQTTQIYSAMQRVYDRFQILRPNYIANFSFNPEALQFKISESYRKQLCRDSDFYSSAGRDLSSKL